MSKAIDLENGLPAIKTWVEGKFVEKESGKGLSTNDYTTTEKNKLAGIAAGAEVNVNADWNATSGDAQILNKPSIPTATTTTPKMDGTAAVGSETKWAKGDHVHPTDTSRAPLASPTFTGTPKAPTAAAGTNTTQIATTAFVTTAVDNIDTFDGATASTSGSAGLVPAPTTEMVNYFLRGSGDFEAIDTEDVSGVRASTGTRETAQAWLDDIDDALDDKVDKVTGKGLSTNDYTTTEKNKLAGIEEGAEANVITGIEQTGSDHSETIKITSSEQDVYFAPTQSAMVTMGVEMVAALVSDVKVDGTSVVTSESDEDLTYKVANIDLTGKVDKETGKGLSTNDYTTTEKTKLGNIAAGAQVNVIESVKVNGTALAVSSKAVNVPKATNSVYGAIVLSDSTSSTTAAASGGTAATPKAVSDALAAAKTYADGKVTGLYNYKGSVATYANLPASPSTGDVYNVEAAYGDYPAGTNWAWTGTAWDALGGSFTITFATAAEVTAVLEA